MTQEPTVLVIDDSATSCHFMESILKKEGYGVRTAGDGREGLTMLAYECPHCIILDVVLPGMSGYEICRLLRSKSILQNLPIIMVSTKNTPLDKSWALRQGATDYLIKPFKEEELVRVVKAAIATYEPPSVAALRSGLRQQNSSPAASRQTVARQTAHEQNVPKQTYSRMPAYASSLTGSIPKMTREHITSKEQKSFYALIPFHNQGQTLWEQTLSTSDVPVRHLYEAIDGVRDIETLCHVTQLSREEVLRALRDLLSQHRIRLREPDGRVVSNQRIGIDYRIDL